MINVRLSTFGFCAFLLSGCGTMEWPFLRYAKDAERVNPIVVQWDQRGTRGVCGAKSGTNSGADKLGKTDDGENVSKDVLCPMDLDTWEFPHDRPRPDAKDKATGTRPVERSQPAYAKLTGCYEKYVKAPSLEQISETLERLIAKKVETETGLADTMSAITSANASITDTDKKIKSQREIASNPSSTEEEKAAANAAVAPLQVTLAKTKQTLRVKKDLAAQQRREIMFLELSIKEYAKKKDQLDAQENARRTAGIANATSPGGVQSAETCQGMRNLFQDEILARSEEMCRKHLSDVVATSGIMNADLGFLALLSSTLGAVVSGDVLQRTFSATASVSQGSQTLISKEIYREFVGAAIARAITSEREKRLLEIRVEQHKSLEEYSPAKALRDALDYHESCSFSHGLTLLTEAPEKRALPSADSIRKQIEDLYGDLKKLEESAAPTNGRAMNQDEIEVMNKTRVHLRKQIEAMQEKLRLVNAL